MTDPGRRAVSYLPGRWAALVTDEVCLLADIQLADPALAACWGAADATGAAGVLDELSRAPQSPSFVLVAQHGDTMRLVVGGRAHAEVFTGSTGDAPVVRGAPDPQTWLDETLDPGFDVRLVADDATPFERMSPLPLTSGIVLASFVFSTAVATAQAAQAAQTRRAGEGGEDEDAAGWIPPPLTLRSSEFAVPSIPLESAEPAPQLSGVFRALPWRATLGEPDAASQEPARPPAALDAVDGVDGADSPDGAGADTAQAQAVGSPPPPIPEQPKPSFGAPGYEPPPPAAEAWAWQGWAPEPPPATPSDEGSLASSDGPAYPPPASDPVYPPPASDPVYPPPVYPPPPPPDPASMPQTPSSVLGVLHLPDGETVPVDGEVLLGRAPFAADPSGVRVVEIASPENDISRSHVRISVDGWQVFATDLGSTNGTAVTLPGHPQTLLRPHEPFALVPGAVLALADEAEIRFDAP